MEFMWSVCLVLLATFGISNCFWSGDVVFEDNFAGNSLNLSKWEYEESCGAEFGPGNLQCYTRNNVAVRNGALVITARQERMEDKEFTSGRIVQKGPGFLYGAYVIRARFSRGDHLWPALWVLYETNCRYEEIDIAEYRGQPSESHKLDVTAHWGRRYDQITSTHEPLKTTPFDLSEDFHEYAILWTPEKISWHVDNTKYFEVSLTDGYFTEDESKLPCEGEPIPFSTPTNFIFNLAVGGSFFNSFPPMNVTTWTKPTFEIDWVRIYQS